MHEVGVRELKNQATEIIREVREQQAEYVITYRGKPVARIVPFRTGQGSAYARRQSTERAELAALWAEWDRLAEKVAAAQQGDHSTLETLLEMRRAQAESLEKTQALEDDSQQQNETSRNSWQSMDWLRQEIARQWKTDLTAVEAVSEQRR
jgi:prevent-host-death family protein